MTNALNWFEIPVTDMDRAKAFYGEVLGSELKAFSDVGGRAEMILPYQDGVGGALVQHDDYVPSQEGSVVYLNSGDDLSVPLGRVEKAGGKVLVEKMGIGENGFIAFFLDTEGNQGRLAFGGLGLATQGLASLPSFSPLFTFVCFKLAWCLPPGPWRKSAPSRPTPAR